MICANKEIPDDALIRQVRRWAAASELLNGPNFDLLQIAEVEDGRAMPRALCGLLRGELLMAGAEEAIPSVVGLFYKARDDLNREFWEDQVRRLLDVVADEYLGGSSSGGVQLLVHHSPPSWPIGLEIGDHRLMTELEVLHTASLGGSSVSTEMQMISDGGLAHTLERRQISQQLEFHEVVLPHATAAVGTNHEALPLGHYVLRGDGGRAVCGTRVLQVLPMRVVCGSAWALEGHEDDLTALLAQIRRKARRYACSLVADRRDSNFQRLCTANATKREWHVRRPHKIAITAVPMQLPPEQQVKLAERPLLIPWEFLPYHAGRVVVM